MSMSCWVCGLVGDRDEGDDKDGLEDGEAWNSEALRARRGMERSRRETSFIVWRKERTLSRRLGCL
jgi:hypothetical protein